MTQILYMRSAETFRLSYTAKKLSEVIDLTEKWAFGAKNWVFGPLNVALKKALHGTKPRYCNPHGSR